MNRLFVVAFLLISNVICAFSAPASTTLINNSGFYISQIDTMSNGKWMLTGLNGSIFTSDNIEKAFEKKMTLANALSFKKARIGNDWILNIMLPNTLVTKFVRYRSDKDTVELIKSMSNQVYTSIASQGTKIFASGAVLAGTALKGTIISSTDEGNTWKTLFQTSNSQMIMSVVAKGNDTLMACGYNGYLAFSYDNGNTWNEDYIGLNIELNQIFLLGNRIIITSEKSGIFYFDADASKWVQMQFSNPINDDISLGMNGDKLIIVTNTTGIKGIIIEYDFATNKDNLLFTSPDESYSALYLGASGKFYIGTYTGNILEISNFTSVEDNTNTNERILKMNVADRGEMMQLSAGAEANASKYDWSIIDILGNVVSSGASADSEFMVGAPNESGKYFIRIRSDRRTVIEGIIVR